MSSRKTKGNDTGPTAKDVETMVDEMASRWNVLVEFTVRYHPEAVIVIGRALKPSKGGDWEVEAQALDKRLITDRRPRDQQMYTVAWDLYQQLDTGILGFRPRKPAV